MNSKRIGIILMIVFVVGLVAFTLYSRWYVQLQKPLVHITFAESAVDNWRFETRTTIEHASPHFADQGFQWTIDVYIPLEAFQDYMSAPYRVLAIANSDSVYFDEELNRIHREQLDCGGFLYVFEYISRIRELENVPYTPGEGVTVRLENHYEVLFDFVLPFSAVHHNSFSDESYVFTVHRRSGAWGWEYYVRQHTTVFLMPARVGHMANVRPISEERNSPIVYWSDGALYDGALVRLWD